ncbi:MAG: hypothetical protein KatS3mg082_1463 [Nitrospiraceae bacterium]|nr:MAG: hypothetical protein KatS3mg082_1463 [Nitrospiraceae bacterium]
MRKREQGFTMLELLIVIGIIVILVSLFAPRLTGGTSKAKVAAFLKEVSQAASGVTQYINDVGAPPPSVAALMDRTAAGNPNGWNGEYIKRAPGLQWINQWGFPVEIRTVLEPAGRNELQKVAIVTQMPVDAAKAADEIFDRGTGTSPTEGDFLSAPDPGNGGRVVPQPWPTTGTANVVILLTSL